VFAKSSKHSDQAKQPAWPFTSALYAKRMKAIFTISLIFTSLLIQGCPPHSYGIYRYHDVQISDVPVPCIEEAIKSIAGVTYLGHEIKDGGRTLTMSGLLPPDKVYKFKYSYKNQENRISIINKTNNGLQYHHAANSYNIEEANNLVATLNEVINRIDGEIEKSCSFSGLINKSSYSCDVEACNGSI